MSMPTARDVARHAGTWASAIPHGAVCLQLIVGDYPLDPAQRPLLTGPARDKVTAAQRRLGLFVDGRLGPQTWHALALENGRTR